MEYILFLSPSWKVAVIEKIETISYNLCPTPIYVVQQLATYPLIMQESM